MYILNVDQDEKRFEFTIVSTPFSRSPSRYAIQARLVDRSNYETLKVFKKIIMNTDGGLQELSINNLPEEVAVNNWKGLKNFRVVEQNDDLIIFPLVPVVLESLPPK